MSRIIMQAGKKVNLVVLEKQDINFLYHGMNNIETNIYLNTREIYYKEDIEKKYENFIEEDDSIYFSIYSKKEKKVIGICGITDLRYLAKKGNIYIFIYDKKNHKKGYSTETIELLINYGFKILGLNKLGLSYIEGNKYAKQIYEKLGFIEVGVFKEDAFIRGDLKDQIFMEIYN